MTSGTAAYDVTLENCAREPIHIPGRIQDHGALLAIDAASRRLTHRSTNAEAVLGADAPALGETLPAEWLARLPGLAEAIDECLRQDGVEVQPVALEVQLARGTADFVAHRYGERVVLEFELRTADASAFDDQAFKGHRALSRLRRQRSIDELLVAAAEEVRTLTGFDRVMAYRFRHDDSGDVVAESKIESLEPFLGRRYPASDIPAQARRLYTLSTLRHIVNVTSDTVAVEATVQGGAGPDSPEPLDMSWCVLRGVSPVHIEYLRNMGVGASMSISIVINGKLWGMLACHHMAPRLVPYTVRSACDVLAQVLAANVQGLDARAHAARVQMATSIRSQAVDTLLHSDDGVFALLPSAGELADALDAGGLVLSERGRVASFGELAAPVARALVQWLEENTSAKESLKQANTLAALPDALRVQMGVWTGYLALRFSLATRGWLVFLRKEQVETIDWGGRPEKEYVHGPLGPRLTPRGSFDVWKETVSGQAVPWSAADLEIAGGLFTELLRASDKRSAELDRARGHLLAMLGEGVNTGDGVTPQASADGTRMGNRMQRLIANVLDATRLQSGQGLSMRLTRVDLSAFLRQMVDSAEKTWPDTRFIREIPNGISAQADAERLGQLVGGLITNARQHGAPGEAVIVQLQVLGDTAEIDVSNVGDPIEASVVEALFDPFRVRDGLPAAAQRSSNGLGLGLYVARHIALGHDGALDYTYADPYVMFSLRLPIAQG